MKYVDPRVPKYQDGMRVKATADLHNDGSYPDYPPDSLLVATGMTGEIINELGDMVTVNGQTTRKADISTGDGLVRHDIKLRVTTGDIKIAEPGSEAGNNGSPKQ